MRILPTPHPPAIPPTLALDFIGIKQWQTMRATYGGGNKHANFANTPPARREGGQACPSPLHWLGISLGSNNGKQSGLPTEAGTKTESCQTPSARREGGQACPSPLHWLGMTLFIFNVIKTIDWHWIKQWLPMRARRA